MVVRDEYEGHAVVFAEREKLMLAIDRLLSEHSPSYNFGKRAHAIEGLREAARFSEGCCVPGPNENPLPLPLAYSDGLISAIGFTDGLTRTALLVELGAPMIPLQADFESAATLHRIFGGVTPPIPVNQYRLTDEARREMIFQFRPRN